MRTVPEFRLIPEPVSEEARRLEPFRFAPKEVGHRHKLGGAPDSLQPDAVWPVCPECGSSMSFYGQLDSINDEFVIADCGVIQVFLCWDCLKASAVLDSY